MVKSELASLLLGSRTGPVARRQLELLTAGLTQGERTSLLESPAATRKHAWLALSPHVPRLKKDPYAINAFEDDDVASGRDSLDLRDWFARTFECTISSATLPAATPPRESFAAWRIFQERRHASKVYVPRSSVHAGLVAAGFQPKAADGALVSAPSGDALVTHVEYARMQNAIRAFVRDASLVRPGLADALDLSGLDDAQKSHARGVASAPFSCLNGRAGTGKTTLVAAIVSASIKAGISVVCLAPTHRAKKNLANRLPANASLATIDAFVKSTRSDAFKRTRRYVFVDEASMICLVKMARLARATMDSAAWQVCLVGDAGQLEPIGRGEIFRTALTQGGPAQFTLEKCYRAKHIDLFHAQTAIRSGSIPSASDSVGVTLLGTDAEVDDKVAEYIKTVGADAQYIAWTNRTCDMINRLVQEKVHGKSSPKLEAMVGDRVVYIGRNEPRKGLTNAMVGTVEAVSAGRGLSVAWEDGPRIDCAAREAALAYCLTVHKAQGSEFERVCVVATNVAAMSRSLDRRWFYTAVSRAKSRCDIIATRDIAAFVACSLRKKELVSISFATRY